MKMHRANIQAVRFKERDADAERLNQNRHQLHQCEMHLKALRASIEDLEANDLELTLQVQALTDQMAQEEVRHQLDLERLSLNQTMTEKKFEDHSEQCMKLVCFAISLETCLPMVPCENSAHYIRPIRPCIPCVSVTSHTIHYRLPSHATFIFCWGLLLNMCFGSGKNGGALETYQ